MNENQSNKIWQSCLDRCLNDYNFIVRPRNMEVRELLGASYSAKMPAFLDLTSRNVNLPFMFSEAAWIISGSNRLSGLTPYMKSYKNFSDDGVFLKGAYGPKVVEQFPYILEALKKDKDSRQAVMSIWRERPSGSKDVPCTLTMQFFIREDHLHMIVGMRSNDVVLGLTYDIFTFSMVAKAVQLLLSEAGVHTELGTLTVNAGSLHIYEKHYEEAKEWIKAEERDMTIRYWVEDTNKVATYEQLIEQLQTLAYDSKFYRNRYEP